MDALAFLVLIHSLLAGGRIAGIFAAPRRIRKKAMTGNHDHSPNRGGSLTRGRSVLVGTDRRIDRSRPISMRHCDRSGAAPA